MADRSSQPAHQHSPGARTAQAIQAAAQAVDAHQAAPDTATLRDMQTTVQAALNLGAHPHDIRDARTEATK
jgi:hypothetical protein